MSHNQKSTACSGQRSRLALVGIVLLNALLLGLVFTALGSPRPVTAQGDNPNPPNQVVKLVFIHHSCGENWLTDGHGDLGLALGNNNYFVSDTNYGWGPNSIGDRTDILNWPEWFTGPDSGMYLDALYNLSEQNSWYTRQLADPDGENQIIMFKSCFPNSNLEGGPGDPPSDDDYLTVGRAKLVYIDLLSYFATRPDKLFVAITAPPVQDPTYSANARSFNNWLVHEWLQDYPYRNVAVFDFYNVLTGPDNHHRFQNDTIEHITDRGGNTLYYPTNGDDHPSPAGNQKATSELVPLLNIYYHRWQEGGPRSQPAATQAPAVEEPATEKQEIEESEVEEPSAETDLSARPAGSVIDDFEGTYEPDQGWEGWTDEQTSTSLDFARDNELAHRGTTSLRLEFDIAPGSWADIGRSFEPAQDWSDGVGLALWLRFSEATESNQGMSVILSAGEPEAATPFETWFEISPEDADPSGWILVELPWDRFTKPDWADEGGLTEFDPAQVVGLGLSFGAPDDSWVESSVWVDDIALLSETPQPTPTEAAPTLIATSTTLPPPTPTALAKTTAAATEAAVAAAPTSPLAPAVPPAEEGPGSGLCPVSLGLTLVGLVLLAVRGAREQMFSQ